MHRLIQQHPATDNEALQQIAAALTEANLRYLCHCVSFWRAAKPNCGVKDWLDSSIRRSTHRLASDGLRETIARLSDEDLLHLGEKEMLNAER